MPVKIVDDNGGATSIKDGTIQKGDLNTITKSYIKNVSLIPIPPQQVIIKRNSFYFTKAQLFALFDKFKNRGEDADSIEIALGIQLPNSEVTCQGKPPVDNTDCLAVVISMTKNKVFNPYNNVGDYVLINGYTSFDKPVDPIECCPGTKPPPRN